MLAFGDSSTWASKVESEASRARAASRADAGRVSGEGQQQGRHRVVSLRGTASSGASAARGARGGPTGPTSPSVPSNPNFAPRAAWPEGKFTITYPRGYDPDRRRFVDGGARATNVTVEKLPPAKRAALEAERKAREEAAARAARAAEEASRAAAEALNLDADYLERARRLRERAAARRKRPRGAAGVSPSGSAAESAPDRPAPSPGRTDEKSAPHPEKKSAPTTTTTTTAIDPAVLATLGVDEGYMARLRDRDDARRRVRAARKSAAKAKARETFDGDEEMAAYAAQYAERARERAEQRAHVAAARAEAAKAAAAKDAGAGRKRRR